MDFAKNKKTSKFLLQRTYRCACTDCTCFMAQHVYPATKNVLFIIRAGGSKAEIVSRRKIIYHKRRQGHMICTDCIFFMAQYVYPSIKNVFFYWRRGLQWQR